MRHALLLCLSVGLFAAVSCAKAEPKFADDPAAGGSGGAAGAAGTAGVGGASQAGSAGSAQAGAAGAEAGAAGEGGEGGGGGAGGEAGEGGEGGAAGEAGAGGEGGEGGAAGDGGKAGSGGAPKPCENTPLLNELMASRDDGSVDEKYEFLELLAVGDDDTCEISLEGYKVMRDDVEIWGGAPSPGFKKGKRFVLGGESFSADGKPTDQGFLVPQALPSGKACIELYKGSSLIDRVCYGGASDAPAPPPGKSIGRSPDGADTDSDSDDFKVFDTPTPKSKNQ